MPRKVMLTDPACIQACKRLKNYLREQRLTPTTLSRKVGCNQSTVQRFLAGDTKTITPAVREMLVYAKIKEQDCIDASIENAFDNAHIRKALAHVWDGQDETAQKLAKLITAVAPLVDLRHTSTAN